VVLVNVDGDFDIVGALKQQISLCVKVHYIVYIMYYTEPQTL